MSYYSNVWFAFEYKSKNISIVKKKLQSELRVVDLKRFSYRKFCYIYFTGDRNI